MTLRKIALVGEPVLRAPAADVPPEEIRSARVQQLVDDLIETMRDADGAGLAATQIFEPWRVCVIEVRTPNARYPYKPGIPLTVLINPRITPLGEETFDNYEGCLSVPDLRGVVRRHAHVRVEFFDRDGDAHDVEVKGITAGTYQHEVDHLDGKLFLDRVDDPTTLTTWKGFARYREAAFAESVKAIVARYGS